MDERTGQVVSELLKERERLGDNIAELERKIRQKTSWQVYFARKPWATLAVAISLGFLLSTMLVRKWN